MPAFKLFGFENMISIYGNLFLATVSSVIICFMYKNKLKYNSKPTDNGDFYDVGYPISINF